MKFGILFVMILLIGFGSASGVTCTIVNDKVLVEANLSEGDKVILPEDYSLLEVNDGVTSFISRDFIRKDGDWIFVLPVTVDSGYDLEVVLPSGFVLSDDLVYPRGYELVSDGKSIILKWENVDEKVIIFYEGPENSYVWFWLGIFCLIVAGFLFWRFREIEFIRELDRLKKEARVKDKIKIENNISYNLFGEEKRVVEFLARGGSCWGKEIVRELGLSKVMVTRKIRSLKEKGIVSVEKMGREIRVSLRKN